MIDSTELSLFYQFEYDRCKRSTLFLQTSYPKRTHLDSYLSNKLNHPVGVPRRPETWPCHGRNQI